MDISELMIKNYSGLFTRVDGDISNLNIDYIRIDNDSNVLSGVISGIYNGNLYNVTVNNLSVRGNGGLFINLMVTLIIFL